MAFCSYFKIQPVAGGADRIKKSEWKLVSHDNSQPPPRAGTAAAFYRFRLPASYCQPPAFVEPLSLRLFRVHLSLSSTFRFSVSFSSCVPERSNFFHLFPHDATRCDATPRFSVTLLFQSVSRSASGIVIQPSRTHTPKGISSTALNTAAACAPSRSLVPAYRDVSCISIYKSYYIRVYRHSYDRTCEPDRPLSSSRAPGVDRINCLFPWRLLIGPSFASRFNVAPLFAFLAPARGLTRQATGNLPPEVPITLSDSFPTAQLSINTPFMLFNTVTFFY